MPEKIKMIYAMQVYNLSIVNRVLVNDCLSSVPITSWPLMFANSGLAACYVREVRGNTQGAFTGTWPQQKQLSSASVCWPLCTAVLYKKTKYAFSGWRHFTLTRVRLRLWGNWRHKPHTHVPTSAGLGSVQTWPHRGSSERLQNRSWPPW